MIRRLALFAVLCAGCSPSKRKDHPSPSATATDPTIEKVVAMRDQAPDGQPHWPAGTRRLVDTRVIALAVDHGAELVAASAGILLRIPKDGSAAAALADFPDSEIRDIVLTTKHAIVTVFPKAPDGIGIGERGKLVAIPLTGTGKPVTIGTSIDALVALATRGDDLYVSYDRHRVSVAHEPDLAKDSVAIELPADTKEAIRKLRHIVVDGTGLGWTEEDFVGAEGHVEIVDAVVARATGSAAPPAVRIAGSAYGSTLRSAGDVWYVLATKSANATAPGGGTYFEDAETLSTLDPATGALTPVAPPLDNAIGMEMTDDASACIAVRGPKLEFGKQSRIVARKKGASTTTELATGLLRASVIAIDASHCYVVEQGKPGVAVVPY